MLKWEKRKSSNVMIWKVIRLVIMLVVCGGFLSASFAATYTWTNVDCGCCDRQVSVGELTSADYDQSSAAQDAAWETFKGDYEGLVDDDRLGNQTRTYNCHAYVFYGSARWLNDPTNYLDESSTSGCWSEDNNGTIKHDESHTCYVTDNEGKCGSKFLCKNNQYVYGSLPTQKYSEN